MQLLNFQVKQLAKSIVPTISDVWGGDVHTAIINALTESAAENVNIEQKVKATQDILKSLINQQLRELIRSSVGVAD